ncbi:hypothetical protein [Paucidesulfovibrio longus]|uniref:hypothetical protein n=1 Tax=Paucidesulfovibrio longus TaxID=889 RepID=UPI0003B49765|nr:hypothetical protein [Paucidesulfovibrio longus]
MKSAGKIHLVLCCIAALLLAGLPARAAQPGQGGADRPLEMVKAIYAPYLGKAPMTASWLDQLAPIAAPRLAALLERERSCQAQYLKACKYLFDVIANGEKPDVRGLQLQLAAPSKETMEIAAMFTNNGAPARLVYQFRKMGGKWLLEDIRSMEGETWSLVKLLQ